MGDRPFLRGLCECSVYFLMNRERPGTPEKQIQREGVRSGLYRVKRCACFMDTEMNKNRFMKLTRVWESITPDSKDFMIAE